LAQLLHHLSPAYKYLTPLLVASRTSITTSLPLPSFRAPPPLTTAVEAHRSPPVHMVPPPPTTSAKVRKGKEPSRPPLRFLPSPDRRRTLVHRRAPPPPCQPAVGSIPPSSVLFRRKQMAILPKTPALFLCYTKPSLLYSLCLFFFFQKKPYPINQFTNQPLLFQSQ
jgi:hypothetical protein